MRSPTMLREQLSVMRPLLVKFADRRLHNRGLAEDAVQDTLVAVLENPERFQGRSSFRTYVTGILNFKIVDNLRSCARESKVNRRNLRCEEDFIDKLCSVSGASIGDANISPDPLCELEAREFFVVLEAGLRKMPDNARRAFVLRELVGWETADVCEELAVTSSNAWVLLHRARRHLRAHLKSTGLAPR